MKKSLKAVICLAVVIIASGVVHAGFAKAADAIKYRKAVMFLTAAHFKAIGAMVQGNVPFEKTVFAKNAAVLEVLSTLPWEAMIEPGTDKGDTSLSSAAFKKSEKFKATAQSFENETAKLGKLAAAGNFESAKAQFGVVAGSCKSCHSQFKGK